MAAAANARVHFISTILWQFHIDFSFHLLLFVVAIAVFWLCLVYASFFRPMFFTRLVFTLFMWMLIKPYKSQFYARCHTYYTRVFANTKLFQNSANFRWFWLKKKWDPIRLDQSLDQSLFLKFKLCWTMGKLTGRCNVQL